mgnify:CR=1 FL=1
MFNCYCGTNLLYLSLYIWDFVEKFHALIKALSQVCGYIISSCPSTKYSGYCLCFVCSDYDLRTCFRSHCSHRNWTSAHGDSITFVDQLQEITLQYLVGLLMCEYLYLASNFIKISPLEQKIWWFIALQGESLIRGGVEWFPFKQLYMQPSW